MVNNLAWFNISNGLRLNVEVTTNNNLQMVGIDVNDISDNSIATIINAVLDEALIYTGT